MIRMTTIIHKKQAGIIACFLIAASCFFYSCNNQIVFSDFQPVKDKMWDKQEEFLFHFEIRDISVSYNMSFQLRNSGIYPYRNLWILFGEMSPSGISTKDTLEYKLADESGKWTGSGITLFQNQFPLRESYHFPDTGKYTISIRHAMRDNQLQGIENVGLLIEKVN